MVRSVAFPRKASYSQPGREPVEAFRLHLLYKDLVPRKTSLAEVQKMN